MLRRSKLLAVSIGIVAVSSLLCLTQEVSSRPGYASSLVLSPLLALLCALTTVGLTVRKKVEVRHGESGSRALARIAAPAVAACAAMLLISFALLMVGAAIRGTCGIVDSLSFFVVGPLSSAAAGTVLGLTAGTLVRRPVFAYLAVSAAWLGSAAADLLAFLFTPKVDIFDHLLGFFAGPLWDEAIEVGPRLWLFRGITWAGITAILAILSLGLRVEDAHGDGERDGIARPFSVSFSLRQLLGSVKGLLSLALLLAVTVGGYHIQVEYGISGSRRKIESLLPKILRTEGALIFLPAGVPAEEAEALRRDVAFRWRQLRKFFGGVPSGGTRLYFFETVDQMKTFTGSGPTSVTKPWLREAYMPYRPAPHPTLKHELAHIFAARWGAPPLRLPGKMGGIVTDPVVLEGTAVAAEWPGDPADPHLLTAAGMKAGLLGGWTPFSSVGFFSTNQGLSYLASGSFVRFVQDRWGKEALASWYGGKSFKEATGTEKEEAVEQWRSFIASLQPPEELVREVVRLYSSPSIFRRKCPHAVAVRYLEARSLMGKGMVEEAMGLLDEIMEMDRGNPLHALSKLRWLSSACRTEAAELLAGKLWGDAFLQRTQPLLLREIAGDLHWTRGRGDSAATLYSEAAAWAYDDSHKRLLALKAWAARLQEEGANISLLLRRYFVCNEGEYPASALSKLAILQQVLEMHPNLPPIHYLIGKVLAGERRWGVAALYFEKSLELAAAGAPQAAALPQREARLALAECLLHSPSGEGIEKARLLLSELLAEPGLSPSESHRVGELKELLAFLEN